MAERLDVGVSAPYQHDMLFLAQEVSCLTGVAYDGSTESTEMVADPTSLSHDVADTVQLSSPLLPEARRTFTIGRMVMETLKLEEMTWPDVAAALENGKTTVVVAAGAVEQHGPHLPLCVDAERGTRLACDVAQRLGNALVAPTIRVGCSEHHMAFSGTISVRESTLRAVCTDYCVSLAHHGFTRICIVPSHGGNFLPLANMLDELRKAVEPGCTVLAYTDLLGFLEIWKRVVGEAGMEERVGGHADVAEGSEMLAIRPDLVKIERAESGYPGEPSGELLDRIFREGLQAVTENGILGDGRGLSAELGEKCLAASADAMASFFSE